MKIQVNGMIYDEANRDCQCHLATTQNELFAFIQCLDLGMDGQETPIKNDTGVAMTMTIKKRVSAP